MKKSTIAVLGALLLSATLASVAQASLIGDTISISHYFPSTGSLYSTSTVTVSAGTGDLGGLSPYYTVNPEAGSILVDFTSAATWTSTAFNGLIVAGIDTAVTSVLVSTNLGGWTASRLAFTASSISANWEGLSFTSDSYFNMSINQSVPDSASTLALFGCALVGLVGFRRKFSNV